MRGYVRLGLLILLCWIVVAPAAQADRDNGWFSSGGELTEDVKNPWFVGTSERVRYCVRVDASSVSASVERIERAIEEAIQYWSVEFRTPWSAWGGRASELLARLEWIKSDCAASDIDVEFKVGYGTLSKEEIAFLGNPLRFGGVTVRKSYERKTLRAQGVVYIASDLGPYRYRRSGTQWIDAAWSLGEGLLLRYALIHELGHVYGLAHSGVGIMAETFFDHLLSQKSASFFAQGPVQGTFAVGVPVETCALSQPARVFFGIKDLRPACLRIDTASGAPSGETQWVVSLALKDSPTGWTRLGVIQSMQLDPRALAVVPAVRLVLTGGQTRFGGRDAERGHISIAHWISASGGAVFRSDTDQASRALRFSITPTSFELIGAQQGMTVPLMHEVSLVSSKISLEEMTP